MLSFNRWVYLLYLIPIEQVHVDFAQIFTIFTLFAMKHHFLWKYLVKNPEAKFSKFAADAFVVVDVVDVVVVAVARKIEQQDCKTNLIFLIESEEKIFCSTIQMLSRKSFWHLVQLLLLMLMLFWGSHQDQVDIITVYQINVTTFKPNS